jgi:ribosomal protein S1
MTKNKIMLHEQQDIIPMERTYHDKIDFFITSSRDLTEGTILFINKNDVFIDFGTKPIIKVSKKELINTLINIYYILNTSYLLIKSEETLSKTMVKEWVKNKVKRGEKLCLTVETIDAISNSYRINLKKTLTNVKYNKFFIELSEIKTLNKSVKGYILNNIKGGFTVAIGGLIAFLPFKELVKKPNNKVTNRFTNTSMEFKISKINFANKNVVLRKA